MKKIKLPQCFCSVKLLLVFLGSCGKSMRNITFFFFFVESDLSNSARLRH